MPNDIETLAWVAKLIPDRPVSVPAADLLVLLQRANDCDALAAKAERLRAVAVAAVRYRGATHGFADVGQALDRLPHSDLDPPEDVR